MHPGMCQLLVKLFCSARGYVFWHRCVHKYDAEQNRAFILVPSKTEQDMVDCAIKFLPAFLKKNGFRSAVFLLPKSNQIHAEKIGSVKEVSNLVMITEKQEKRLIDFYNANLNDVRFIVASFTVPEGRNFLKYLQTGQVTPEELFRMGIYGLEPPYNAYQHLADEEMEICRVE